MHALRRRLLGPAPHKDRLPEQEVDRLYPHYRLRILSVTFAAYAGFYLVRNNLSPVAKEMQAALGYDKSMIGNILALSAITYGVGKLLMGSVSDQSDARKFLTFGMLLTAACNFAFGATESYRTHLWLWGLNGFVQGMGWGPCGRSLGHWYSVRERGTVFAVWNISHNVGGGIAGMLAAWSASRWGWEGAFFVPGLIALAGAACTFWLMVDTPQSVGLPPIEIYKNDFTEQDRKHGTVEHELTTKELFVDNVLLNKYLWLVAMANFFVYIVRYSMLDWGPTYLREMKGASLEDGGGAIMAIEFGGIPSTILVGWFSDRVGGRRGMVSVLCMIPILLAFAGILFNPPGRLWLDLTLLGIVGFFVYPPVMLLGVLALDLTSKKAVGVAAGFVGLFGYLGRTAQASAFGAMADHYTEVYNQQTAWEYVLISILGCTVMAIVLLAFMWNVKPRA